MKYIKTFEDEYFEKNWYTNFLVKWYFKIDSEELNVTPLSTYMSKGTQKPGNIWIFKFNIDVKQERGHELHWKYLFCVSTLKYYLDTDQITIEIEHDNKSLTFDMRGEFTRFRAESFESPLSKGVRIYYAIISPNYEQQNVIRFDNETIDFILSKIKEINPDTKISKYDLPSYEDWELEHDSNKYNL